jgi:AIG2-like family
LGMQNCTNGEISAFLGMISTHPSDRRWIINRKGYASVIPSSEDRVLGFIYELNPKDETSLDGYEQVNVNYEKRTLPVQLITSPGDGETATTETIQALIYIDFTNTTPDNPKTEYIYRINMAMQDALKKGIPQSYIDKYIRPFIPAESQ